MSISEKRDSDHPNTQLSFSARFPFPSHFCNFSSYFCVRVGAPSGIGDGNPLTATHNGGGVTNLPRRVLPVRILFSLPNSHTRDLSQLLWVGPVPGDIAEIEAYCRIFRAAEQLQNAVMSALCDPETGECPVRYDVPSEDLPVLEDKVALASYLVPNEPRGLDIWMRLQRLKNACYDAGFARVDGHPCPTLFANWFPVYFSAVPDYSETDELEVAFWRGGQVSEEGLAWLLAKGFRTIVDLREEDVKDDLYLSAVGEAVSSGKIEVVNMPVEIGTAPSAEQVQQFAALVSDGTKKPIYLHSKEGINRTSAMVSRWKQYATRAERLATKKHSPIVNGKALKNDPTNGPGSSSNGSENGAVVKSDRTVDAGEAHDIDIEITSNNLEVTNSLPNGQSTEQDEMHDSRTELLSDFKLETSPLKAQFPTCNVFSRKEMTKFFRSKRVYPKSVLNSRRRSSSLMISRRKQNLRAEHNEAIDCEAADMMVLKNANGTLFDNDYILSVSSGITNGKSSNNGTSTSFEEKGSEASLLTIDPKTSNASNPNGNAQLGSQKPSEKNGGPYLERYSSDTIDGSICATTGVVRVQSRRKAEMFLVASFLHHQEKMNVLVEPDVHDIFARIPGYGFVQTFYTQDTSDLHERVDFVTCLGGDGVILHASNLFRTSVPPVVSFNLGSLGFLTSHIFEGFRQDMRAVIHGNNTLGVYITLRMRLRCVIFRNGKAMPGKVFDVLNEVVVDRGSNPYLSKIECYEHNHLITKVQGDGVIVATPTGSTAYSTAAGGSMVHPNVPCMLFTPICPHSLSFRPVILPDSARLELKIPDDARSNAWVSFDGKRRQQLSRGDSVHISMSEHPLPTVNKSDQTGDWFRSLIRCLNWNERLDQKAL
ncbi:putative NAD kinase 2, chloroplastic [Triticum urartu]|uniref:NAD(+) kinase n=1 Tax=Triticum urartu TaxID=4572 RepID=M7ZJL3_TRIUA|nr:putative NAD kinase 2, chloroplastic [Triticum urartu]